MVLEHLINIVTLNNLASLSGRFCFVTDILLYYSVNYIYFWVNKKENDKNKI